MTTYTSISDTSFSIKFTTANYNDTEKSYSKRVKHCGLEWVVYVYRSQDNKLCVFLACFGNNTNNWNTSIKNTTKLYRNDNTFVWDSYFNDHDCEKKHWGWHGFTHMDELTDEFINDGKITVECVVEIQAIFGNHPERKHNFHDKDSKLSDVALMVEDKPFYVNKAMLGCFSPVFHAMFYSDFKEKNKDKVKLEDVKQDDFERYLQLLYQCSVEIDATNVDSLLMLADRYNTPMITLQCESFLLATSTVKKHEKLAYAEKYLLLGLKTNCVSSIETLPAYEEACVGVEKRDKTTMVGLIHKAIAMMKKMTTTAATTAANP